MQKFGKSQSKRRSEDVRFLTGQGQYIDDVAPENALYAYFLRSPVAHAEITSLDVSAARESEGVHLVVTAADLEEAGLDLRMKAFELTNSDGTPATAPLRPMLAKDRMRFVGEPVVLIVAETLSGAKTAAEMIELDFEELPISLDVYPGAGPDIHPEAAKNRAFDWDIGDKAGTAKALEHSDQVVRLEVGDNRIIVNSMEPRGCYAEWGDDRLHFAYSGQGVWGMKSELSSFLQLDAEAIRVTTPDVGGGFGMKGATYPEYFSVCFAAKTLGLPVRWMAERGESMLSDNGGRDLVTMAEMGFDVDGKITAYRVHTFSNLGAYSATFGQGIQSLLFSKVLTATYDIPFAYMRAEGVYTNTNQVDAYRGAGRPEAIYVIERMMDRAARDIGMDPFELRRRNFITPEQMPYLTPTGETYDVGDFATLLGIAEQGRAGFDERRAESQARGKLRGLGLSYYIESILGSPSEDVKIEFCEGGTVKIYVGTQSNGQGHETVYAQFLADHTGIPYENIEVVQGDSDLIATGGGTGGSRSVTVQANVTLASIDEMLTGFKAFLAKKMDVEADQIRFDDERFRAEGSNLSPSLIEAAEMARSEAHEDLLSWTKTATIDARSYPNGAHIAEIEIDPETGTTSLEAYWVVDDFGNLINPLLVEGQVHGGIAQGVGQAFCEHVVYDDSGQLLTASFMDYAMPRASDFPMVGFQTHAVPSTGNPMGMKGCGEAGTVGAMAAVMNAAQDALWSYGIKQVDMPLTPNKLWKLLKNAKQHAA